MAKKTPPCPVCPSITTARYWQFIRSGLRQGAKYWPPKRETMEAACTVVETGGEFKSGSKEGQPRTAKRWTCASCDQLFPATGVQVDHIIPAGSLKSPEDLVPFVAGLFCARENLQVLCKDCHHTKTQLEKQ
jgi:5-methylcytosine-specific restriction endonuclease McrA